MATYTYSSGSAYGYITTSNPSNVTVTDSSFTITKPAWSYRQTGLIPSTASRYYSTNSERISISSDIWLYASYFGSQTTNTVANQTTWATLPSSTSPAIDTSKFFGYANRTERVATAYLRTGGVDAYSGGTSYDVIGTSEQQNTIIATCSVTLNVPPTFAETFSYTGDYSGVPYANLTTANVKLSSLTAYYGGDFTGVGKAEFTIGSQTVTKANPSNNNTLSIPLGAVGTFTPTVTVTDSRGQTTTHTLNAITVQGYVAPTVSFSVERTLPKTGEPTPIGKPDDEGESATITATLNFTDAIATLSAPTVEVADEDGNTYTPTVTWYSSRASDGSLSGSVDWSSLSSGGTVYGLATITGDFDTQKSYQIAVTPIDSEGTGATITQTLGSAFYTVDFLAGGHGIAFGQPASQDGFFCNMPANFVDANDVMRALFDFIHPVGSYYETSDTTFDPNVTWGGTWVKDSAGRVTVAQDADDTDFDTIGELGGAKTHTLIADQLPKIEGSFDIRPWRSGTTNGATQVNASGVFGRETGSSQTGVQTSGASATSYKTTMSFGNNQPHNNLQPYVIVNRWHRTA